MKTCSHCKKDTIRDLTSSEKANHLAQEAGMVVQTMINPISLFKNVFYKMPLSFVHTLQGYKHTLKLYKCDYCQNYALICPYCKKLTAVGSHPPVFDSVDIFVCANCNEKFLYGDWSPLP